MERGGWGWVRARCWLRAFAVSRVPIAGLEGSGGGFAYGLGGKHLGEGNAVGGGETEAAEFALPDVLPDGLSLVTGDASGLGDGDQIAGDIGEGEGLFRGVHTPMVRGKASGANNH